jgi:hypothetical protein
LVLASILISGKVPVKLTSSNDVGVSVQEFREKNNLFLLRVPFSGKWQVIFLSIFA